MTDEGFSSTLTTTTTTTTADTCENLTTTAAAASGAEAFTTTNPTWTTKTSVAVIIGDEEKFEGAKDPVEEGTMKGESIELTMTSGGEDDKNKTKEKSQDSKMGDEGEEGESYNGGGDDGKRSTAAALKMEQTKISEAGATEMTSTTTVTGSEDVEEGAATAVPVTKQSYDSKLENIIASKEFSTFDNTATPAASESESQPLSYSLREQQQHQQQSLNEEIAVKEAEVVVVSAAMVVESLTLESPGKMNKEIGIGPLTQEMSKTEGGTPNVCRSKDGEGKSEGLDNISDSTTAAIIFPALQKSHKSEDSKSNPKAEAMAVLASSAFPPTASSTSSSSPSSTNESSTSSPVNEGTSLMRSQSKLASRKNLAREDDGNGTTASIQDSGSISGESKGTGRNNDNNVGGTSSKNNSKKNKHNKSSSSKKQQNNGNKNNKGMSERNDDDSINLLEIVEESKKKKKKHEQQEQQRQMDNGEENNKSSTSSAAPDETSQEGQEESRNQMTSSTTELQSGQQQPEAAAARETCSSSTSSPQEVVPETASTFSLPDSCSAGLMTTEEEKDISNITTSSSSSRKPTDLTVQCPAASGGNDDGQYDDQALELQRSPSLANEPSSPDSLNTNQSVAGSEFAPGENLSVSESDLMNRTTSIDEVEEDLPQEAEFIVGTEQAVGFTVPNSSNMSGEDFATKNPSRGLSTLTTLPPNVPPDEVVTTIGWEASCDKDVLENTEKVAAPDNDDNIRTSPTIETSGADAAVEESIKSTSTTNNIRTTTATPSSILSGNSRSREQERTECGGDGEHRTEAPLRPQSITLAVAEWLKTQGEGALTPVIALRASSSDEGDVEEETTSDDEDSADYDENERNESKKRDDKASNLEQNQKNVYGNPWVAPSNKSGSSTKVSNKTNGSTTASVRSRRSGSKKSNVKAENDGSQAAATEPACFPQSDGVICSRVAPLFSTSSKLSSSPSTTTRSSSSHHKNNNAHNNNNISPCSTSSISDDDANIVPPSISCKSNNASNNFSNTTLSSNDYLKQASNITNDTSTTDKGSLVINESGRDYDSGLELSSPENSPTLSSVSTTSSQNDTGTSVKSINAQDCNCEESCNVTEPAAVINAKNKSKDLANPSSSSCTETALIKEISNKKSAGERPALPKLITNNNATNHLKKYFSPNPDQIVIAAPLSIIQQEQCSITPTYKKTASSTNENDVVRSSPSPASVQQQLHHHHQLPSAFSTSTSSSCNNTAPTSPLAMTGGMLFNTSSSSSIISINNNNAVQSPLSSMPSSSTSVIDERDHAEICDPQRYAKYYQFGVVFDTSDDPDQGIDTAAEEEEGESEDSLQDIELDALSPANASAAITENVKDKDNDTITPQQKEPPPQHKHSAGVAEKKQHQEQQKNTNDFPERNRKVASRSGGKKSVERKRREREENNGSDVLVSKSVYLQDEDEEIGTFDPKVVLESRRLRRASCADGGGINATTEQDENACLDDYYAGENAVSSSAPSTAAAAVVVVDSNSSSHLYINPFSLAAELSGSEMVKVGGSIEKKNVVVDGDNSSSEESEEPPLPPYESPPSVEIPVYNTNTPAARVIRPNFYAIGDPVSGAICCSIQ